MPFPLSGPCSHRRPWAKKEGGAQRAAAGQGRSWRERPFGTLCLVAVATHCCSAAAMVSACALLAILLLKALAESSALLVCKRAAAKADSIY